MSNLIIGFSNKFYTLWSYEIESIYNTDSYGNHHKVSDYYKYFYIKNISKDIEKVKNLYPGITINDELKGKNISFTKKVEYDLPVNYFWYGKYSGKLVDEILNIDFQYCVWVVNKSNFSISTKDFISNHPIYISNIELKEKQIKEEQEKIINSHIILKENTVVDLLFTSNGYNIDHENNTCMVDALYDNVEVSVICNGFKVVNGMYSYIMPNINGKAKKVKNKTIKVNILEVIKTEVLKEYNNDKFIHQVVIIK